MQAAQRNMYDRGCSAVGAKCAISVQRTPLRLWKSWKQPLPRQRLPCLCHLFGRDASLPLETMVEVAHRHGVPVIVDAAAQNPPAENLWKFTGMGADLVIFSGGKTMRGPQDSGLIVGKRNGSTAAAAGVPPRMASAAGARPRANQSLGCTKLCSFISSGTKPP